MRSFSLPTMLAAYRAWMRGVTAGNPCPPVLSSGAICVHSGADNLTSFSKQTRSVGQRLKSLLLPQLLILATVCGEEVVTVLVLG